MENTPQVKQSKAAERLHRNARSENNKDQLKAAKSAKTLPEDLAYLTTVSTYEVTCYAWRHSSLPRERIEEGLARLQSPAYDSLRDRAVLIGLSRNTALTVADILSVRHHPVFVLHPHYPVDIALDTIAMLSEDYETFEDRSEKTIASYIAIATHYPDSVYLSLLEKAGTETRSHLAENRGVSPVVVKELICVETAKHNLFRLLTNPVAGEYKADIAVKLDTLGCKTMRTREIVTRYTRDPFVAESGLQHPHPRVLLAALNSPLVPVESKLHALQLASLSNDKRRRGIAMRHPLCPDEWRSAAALMR